MKKKITKVHTKSSLGFVLPFTMMICTIVLFITLGTMTLLSKQLYFSRLDKKSQVAYYAADDAVACAMQIDDSYASADGLGIFPSSSTTNSIVSSQEGGGGIGYTYLNNTLTYVNAKRKYFNSDAQDISLADIKCGQAIIFSTSPTSDSKFTVSPVDFQYHYINAVTGLPEVEYGQTSTFNMRMPVTTGTYRCAKVTINKTVSFREIVAQGYSVCDDPTSAVERAVVNTTVTY